MVDNQTFRRVQMNDVILACRQILSGDKLLIKIAFKTDEWKKCFPFGQNRKLVVIVVKGVFFIDEDVLPYCRSTSEIGLR